jgi:Mg2+ and Co2+ transporter CorA
MADGGKGRGGGALLFHRKLIVSMHRGDCPALATVRGRIGSHHSSAAAAPQVAVFYLIMDTLVDSFFPVLSDFDDSIDDLGDAILKNPTEEQLGTLFGRSGRSLPSARSSRRSAT